MEIEYPPHRDQECYFPGEGCCYWVTCGKYPLLPTSYRCQPGDRMVVDIVTGEARVLPSLSDTVYGEGKPPADEGLAPDEEERHQCPDDIPISDELEGRVLTPVDTERAETSQKKKGPYNRARERGSQQMVSRQDGGMCDHRPLSSPPDTHSQGRPNYKARTRPRGNTPRQPQPRTCHHPLEVAVQNPGSPINGRGTHTAHNALHIPRVGFNNPGTVARDASPGITSCSGSGTGSGPGSTTPY